MKGFWEARSLQGTQKMQRGLTQGRDENDNAYHTPFRMLEVPATLTGPPETGEEGTVPAQLHHSDSLWSHRHFYLPLTAPNQPTLAQSWEVAPTTQPFNSAGLHAHFPEMRPSKRPLWFSGCNLCHPLLCLRCPHDGGWIGVLHPFLPFSLKALNRAVNSMQHSPSRRPHTPHTGLISHLHPSYPIQ